MTAAQRAMATAMIYPDPEKGGRGKKGSVTKTHAEMAGVSQRRISSGPPSPARRCRRRRFHKFVSSSRRACHLGAAVRDEVTKLDEACNDVQIAIRGDPYILRIKVPLGFVKGLRERLAVQRENLICQFWRIADDDAGLQSAPACTIGI
jgi:hypothetical protein